MLKGEGLEERKVGELHRSALWPVDYGYPIISGASIRGDRFGSNVPPNAVPDASSSLEWFNGIWPSSVSISNRGCWNGKGSLAPLGPSLPSGRFVFRPGKTALAQTSCSLARASQSPMIALDRKTFLSITPLDYLRRRIRAGKSTVA